MGIIRSTFEVKVVELFRQQSDLLVYTTIIIRCEHMPRLFLFICLLTSVETKSREVPGSFQHKDCPMMAYRIGSLRVSLHVPHTCLITLQTSALQCKCEGVAVYVSDTCLIILQTSTSQCTCE